MAVWKVEFTPLAATAAEIRHEDTAQAWEAGRNVRDAFPGCHHVKITAMFSLLLDRPFYGIANPDGRIP